MNNLKKIRQKLELNIKEASELIGISASYLSQLETGTRGISRAMITKICNAYHCKPNDLLGYADTMSVIDENDNEFSEQDIRTLRALKSLSDEDHLVLRQFIAFLIYQHEQRIMSYDDTKEQKN